MNGHLEFLRSVAKGNVFEIGVCQCFSTSALLLGVRENGGHVTSVDIEHCMNDVPTLDRPQDNWTFIQADSTLLEWTEPIDVLLIDGGHSYANVKADMDRFIPLVRTGGLVLMHDVLVSRYPGVERAFFEWPTGQKSIREQSYGLGLIRV